jgi:hypothetical protein
MGLRNETAFFRGIDLWVRRQEDMVKHEYQALIWKIFCRILERTPQYSGIAAASWNIGVGYPDMSETSYTSDVDEPTLEARSSQPGATSVWVPPDNVRQRGDQRAIDSAKRRNHPKIALIERRTKVYFTNTATGDMNAKADQGKGNGSYYLEALQDPSYWKVKLRAVNKPYETANESLIVINELWNRTRGQGLGKAGGETWESYI